MKIETIQQYKSTFDAISKTVKDDDGQDVEVWYARELQKVLGYSRWENFAEAIGRAIESCKTLNVNVDDHFPVIGKTIKMPKGATKEVIDYKLSRYACYLIVQNASPVRHKSVALGQTYFAVQT